MNFKRLLPIYLGAMMTPLGGVGVITLLPILAKTWETSIQWVSLTLTLYMVPYVIFQLFSGSIAQIFDTRKVLFFGFGIYALGGFLSGLSPNLGLLLGARIIQGFGAAFIAPIVMALVGEMVHPGRLGRAMGFLGFTYTIGQTMGPLVSGLLEIAFGWPAFFFLLGGLSLIIGGLYWLTNIKGEKTEAGTGKIFDALKIGRASCRERV
jgi:MFS family permease